MKINIIKAYLSHTLEVVAIATDRYYILRAELPKEKGEELVNKINQVLVIETDHWEEKRDS